MVVERSQEGMVALIVVKNELGAPYVRHNRANYPNAAILWQAMSDYVARLRFLNELDLEFDNLDIMDDFVHDMRPVLRSMRAAGRRIFLSEWKDGT